MEHLAQDLDPTPVTMPVTDLEIPSEVLRFKTKSRKTSCFAPGSCRLCSAREVLAQIYRLGRFLDGWCSCLLRSNVRADSGLCYAEYSHVPGDADISCLFPKRGFGRLDKELLGG